MKILPLLPIIILASACSGDTKNESGIVLGDTITTASGLKYIYTKAGEGRPVETGSKVYTYLALSVNGKEVWNTNDQPDSAFVFVANKDRMIRGFTEVTMFLKEGDEIVAILPPDLAYGEKGSGEVIPPNATLIYTQYKMMKVDAPKFSISDSLFKAYKSVGYDQMVTTHLRIMNSADTSRYYYDKGQWRILWNLLTDADMHKEALQMIAWANTTNESGLRYCRVRSYDKLGNYQLAIDSLNALMVSDTSYTNNGRAKALREELLAKVKGTKK